MRKLKILTSIVFSIAVLFSPAIVFAQAGGTAHRGLVVRLPGQDDFYIDYLNLKPGDKKEGTFIVQHEFQNEDKEAVIYIYATDFEIAEDGKTAIDPKGGFFLDNATSIAKYITFDKTQVTLPHYGSTATIKFTLNIPQDAGPGFRYARIIATGTKPAIQTGKETLDIAGAGISSRITVATMLVSIGDPSQYTYDGDFANIRVTDILGNPGIFGWLFDLTPLTASASIKNTGNQPLLLGGNVTFHTGNPANPESFQIFNEGRQRILPNTTRGFDNYFQKGIMYAVKNDAGDVEYKWDLASGIDLGWGKHTVDYRISFKDQKGEPRYLIRSAEFWILPWKAIIVIIILVVLTYLYFRYRDRLGLEKKNTTAAKKPLVRTIKKK